MARQSHPGDPIEALDRRLDLRFDDLTRLRLALTHSSFGPANNQRLEYLGDAVLGLLIADALFTLFPDAKEGRLSRMRARLVRKQTLAEIARELELGDRLILGSGELKTGGFGRDSILADALEAVIGALYLERGLDATRDKVTTWFHSRLHDPALARSDKDAKTRLQEYLQAHRHPLPEYTIVSQTGEGENETFVVTLSAAVLTEPVQGRGNSRRFAEQAAAEAAMEIIDGP